MFDCSFLTTNCKRDRSETLTDIGGCLGIHGDGTLPNLVEENERPPFIPLPYGACDHSKQVKGRYVRDVLCGGPEGIGYD